MGTGASSGGGGTFSTSFGDISAGLFGTDASTTSTQAGTTKGRKAGFTSGTAETTEQLKIDKVGILKLIDEALKGTSGIAEIFGQEAGSGLFDSSGAKKGTEDLLAKIAGELAKVTGVKTTGTREGQRVESFEDTETTATGTSTQESEGLVDQIGGFLGL